MFAHAYQSKAYISLLPASAATFYSVVEVVGHILFSLEPNLQASESPQMTVYTVIGINGIVTNHSLSKKAFLARGQCISYYSEPDLT